MEENSFRVFVTGATGVLGRVLIPELIKAGAQVRAMVRQAGGSRQKSVPGWESVEWIEGDLGDLPLLEKAVEGMDFVVHGAALVSFDPADRELLYLTNAEGTANMVNVCLKETGLRRFLHISSVSTMSPSKPMPAELDERQGFNPDENTSDYAHSKYRAELEVIRGVEEGLPAMVLNPSIILAPGEEDESSSGLFGFVRKERMFYPEGWINYVDARDVVGFILEGLKRGTNTGERYLLSAGAISYQLFFGTCASKLGLRAPFIRARPWMREIAWRLEFLGSLIFRTRPLLTRFTAASSAKQLIYKGKNVQDFWPGFRYHTLEESLDWILKKPA
jgi:nucleoside-diphosphate-sugar epimerase